MVVSRLVAAIRLPVVERPSRARSFTRGRLHLLVIAATLGMSSAAWIFAYALRFEFSIPAAYAAPMLRFLPIVLLVKCLFLHVTGVYRILWAYVTIRDILTIVRGSALATAALYFLNSAALPPGLLPRSVILLDGLLTLLLVGGLFAMLRVLREAVTRRSAPDPAAQRTLIVGAGDSGDALLREVERSQLSGLHVEGFIDDDPDKVGCLLRGIPILGGVNDLPRIARERSIRQVLVAVPSAGRGRLRDIARPLLQAGLSVRMLPPLARLSAGTPLVAQLRHVSIEELLRREPVQLEESRIGGFLRGRRVLVTGAAGSIGSELCRKVLDYHPERLVAFDCAETPLADLTLEIRTGANEQCVLPELGDVTDPVRVRAVFDRHRPDIIFHAAALKHVPVCESHPREAIRVNVGGTKIVARNAERIGSKRFILISTDKAVNPSSLMGATKRVAELLMERLSARPSPTRFAAVRFGNVLGSNGSVLRIFRSQLAQGGPLTVTHPEMRRYFMTIPEAVELVLQAAMQAEGGEVFELDMGMPVRIVDLAEDFIRLSGLEPGRDVKIEFTGVRPGEKLFEELYCHSETVEPTSHPKVFRLKSGGRSGPDPAAKFCLDRLGPIDPGRDPVLARLGSDFREILDSRFQARLPIS